MYNDIQKNRFLDTENRAVRTTVNRIFSLAEMLEILYDKDMYDFTEEQGVELLKTFRSTSIESLGVMHSIIIGYVDWAIRNNLVEDGINHFREITKEQRDQCISNKAKEKYLTFDELKNIINDLSANPTNQFLVLSAWYGVGGKYKDELDNVREEDIYDGVLTLYSKKGGSRYLKIDDYYEKIIRDAQHTYTYYSATGHEKQMVGSNAWKICANTSGNSKVELRVNRSFTRISKLIDVDINYNLIRFSSIIYKIKQRAEELNITNQELVFSNEIFPILDMFEFRTTLSKTQRQSCFWYKFQNYLE